MIYILSWTTGKHKNSFQATTFKLKKIQGIFKDLHRNLRTFLGKMEFKDFSRTSPKIQGLFKTVQTLSKHFLSPDQFINSCNISSLLHIDIVRRILILVTHGT